MLALEKGTGRCAQPLQSDPPAGDYSELANSWIFTSSASSTAKPATISTLLNLKDSLEHADDTGNLLNVALEDVIFKFTKIGEEELVLADKLKNTLRQTREALADNFDQQDPKFITLKEELERLFKKKKLSEVTQEEMKPISTRCMQIHEQVKGSSIARTTSFAAKYHGDAKVHPHPQAAAGARPVSAIERTLFEAALNGVKQDADEQVLQNASCSTTKAISKSR